MARRSLVPIAVLTAAVALTPATASATPDTSAVDAAGPAATAVPGDPPLPEYPGLAPQAGGMAPAVTTTPVPCADNGSDKTMLRADAITRARSWLSVGGVPYSQSRCYKNQYGDYRTDCSGFVSMAWGLGGSGSGFWTGNLSTRSHTIARSDLKPGDALLRHTGDPSENHVALFVKWGNSAQTTPVVIEQTGSGDTIERTWSSSYAGLYTPVRYDKIAEATPPEDVPVSGDWNGDGKDTIGVFRPSTSTWYLRDTNSGDATIIFKFGHGASGDIPVAGDWNGDGKDTVGVFRPSNSTWYLTNGTTGLDHQFIYGHGASGDIPVAGDWNNDGKDTPGVFRTTNSTWYLRDTLSGDPTAIFKFGHGPSGDLPVAGDWNNDGKDTVGVFRTTNSTWYLTNGTTGLDHQFIYGHGPSGDHPVTGDWNNDNADTPGVRRPTNNTVYLRNTNSAGAVDEQFIYGI